MAFIPVKINSHRRMDAACNSNGIAVLVVVGYENMTILLLMTIIIVIKSRIILLHLIETLRFRGKLSTIRYI